MHVLFALLLRAFHFIYAITLNIRSFWQRSLFPPHSLQSPRRCIPKHLAIVFVTRGAFSSESAQDVLSMSVLNAVEWCRSIGIKKLTVYEESGASPQKFGSDSRIKNVILDMLSRCTQQIRENLPIREQEHDCSESEAEYPLTPPPSDYSESRPLSPIHSHGAIPVTTLHIAESVPRRDRNSRLKSINRPSNFVCESLQVGPDICVHRTGRHNPQARPPSLPFISRFFKRSNSHRSSRSCTC
jgi:dehydrodolichyl diphosphate syntase complex subunit NUS1